MNISRSLLVLLLCTSTYFAHAQIEVTNLQTKNFSATGLGAFLHFDIPVNDADYITAEGSFDLFKKGDQHIVIVPFLLGFRRTLDGSGTGFYVEPSVGYSLGASDIFKYDNNGSPIYKDDGSQLERKAKGPTACIGGGYMLPSLPLTIGATYKFVKVSGDPSLHVFALRLSYSLSFGNREY